MKTNLEMGIITWKTNTWISKMQLVTQSAKKKFQKEMIKSETIATSRINTGRGINTQPIASNAPVSFIIH